jgi:hypothetical protein
VGDLVHLVGEETHDMDQDDPLHWLKAVAEEWVWDEDDLPCFCPPDEIVGFLVEVAPGCGPLAMYLAAYPPSLLVGNKPLPTTRATWSGEAHCDTQFASHPRCGGISNFVRAHSSVCRLLDYAQELGILAEVIDYTDFFDNRNVPALVKEVDESNAIAAAFAGAWKDSGRRSSSPIFTYPNFEHLEARGIAKIGPDLGWLKKMEP